MSTHATEGKPRQRAILIGLGLDGHDSQHRVISGDQCLLVGGSSETHADLLEMALRLESELDRRGQDLGEITPEQLAEIALRIDSPELHQLAIRLHEGLKRRGRSFQDSSAEELAELSGPESN